MGPKLRREMDMSDYKTIGKETGFKQVMRDQTNKRDDAFCWRVEPTADAANTGVSDLFVAYDRAIYAIEAKVSNSKVEPPETIKLRVSQAGFLYNISKACVYGYVAIGYIGTDVWYLIPLMGADVSAVCRLDEGMVRMEGTYDLATAIARSRRDMADWLLKTNCV